MVSIGLCAAFSGLTGVGLTLALVEDAMWVAGLAALAPGVTGLVAVLFRASESA